MCEHKPASSSGDSRSPQTSPPRQQTRQAKPFSVSPFSSHWRWCSIPKPRQVLWIPFVSYFHRWLKNQTWYLWKITFNQIKSKNIVIGTTVPWRYTFFSFIIFFSFLFLSFFLFFYYIFYIIFFFSHNLISLHHSLHLTHDRILCGLLSIVTLVCPTLVCLLPHSWLYCILIIFMYFVIFQGEDSRYAVMHLVQTFCDVYYVCRNKIFKI